MMFSRLFSAGSSAGVAARASPRKRTPPGPQVPLPLSCSGAFERSCSVSREVPALAGSPLSAQAVAAERIERRDTRDETSISSRLGSPFRRQRPCTDSSVKPRRGEAHRAAELQGVPRRAEAAEPARSAIGRSSRRRRAQRSRPCGRSRAAPAARPCRSGSRHGAARSSSPRPRRPTASIRAARAGALASRLSRPPVSTEHGAARPDRAARLGQQQALVGARGHGARQPGRRARRRRSATMAPTTRPQMAQRRPALRESSQACSA